MTFNNTKDKTDTLQDIKQQYVKFQVLMDAYTHT